MRKAIYSLAAALLGLASCTENLELTPTGPEREIVLNSFLVAGDTLQSACAAYSTFSKLARIDDATLSCYVNGSLVSQSALGSSDRVIRYFSFKAEFKSGDEVRLKVVTSDGEKAESTVTVPQSASITGADTSMVTLKEDGTDAPDKYLRIRPTVADRPGEKNWYRVQLFKRATLTTVSSETESLIGTKNHQDQEKKIYNHLEPVLNNGIDLSVLGGNNTEEDNYFANALNIFPDETFADRSYTLTLISQKGSYYPRVYDGVSGDSFLAQGEIVVRLWTMTKDAYSYLNAVQFEVSSISGYTFFAPYSYKSNVEGGIGFVTAVSAFDHVIPLPDKIYNMENSFGGDVE